MGIFMTTVYIDSRPYQVNPEQNLLHACLSAGLDLPYFCWHPALGSVGACRQCAVKQFRDEEDKKGKLVMACLTPSKDGTRISIKDGEAAAFRAAVIEGLMLHHPHDCPVCDEGGECHLQDMTVMTGHNYRRSAFPKRTFRNQYLGPFINHEMNRCIQCYRCVRFYREYAGGRDLHAFSLRDTVFFGRHEDGILESEFSGNLVEVCPTGVFTDATLKRHYTRKWDLQMAPSICVHCGLGCNTTPGERYGQLRRIVNRFNDQVNGYFLCDRGRFGYEFVNSEWRIRGPMLRQGESLATVGGDEAIDNVRSLLSESGRAIGIGSPRASVESNFALRRLVGAENFFSGISGRDHRLLSLMLDVLGSSPARIASLHDVEQSDAVLVLGEDLTNVAARMALSLRQSILEQPKREAEKLGIPSWHDAAVREVIQEQKGPLYQASLHPTRLDDVATGTFHAAPDDIARLGFAVARELAGDAPAVPDLPEEQRDLARRIAGALERARRPLVLAGPSCRSEAMIQAAANVARALAAKGLDSRLSFTMPECNTCGLGLIAERSLDDAFDLIQKQHADTVLILENDLYRRAEADRVDRFFEQARRVVVLDHIETPTTQKADVVLPAGTFAEADGTLVNNEGRAQRFFQVFTPTGSVQESWRWLRDVMIAAGRLDGGQWACLDDIVKSVAAETPALAAILEAAPLADFRIAGARIPRAPHRYSGRTAMLAHIDVHEPRPPEDRDSPLSFSMEGATRQPPPALNPFFWSPGWNSIQSVNKYQSEIGGPLRCGEAGVRLMDSMDRTGGDYYAAIPRQFQPRDGEWLIVPHYQIFGSEELSRLAPAIAERAPQPHLALSPSDAGRLEVKQGDRIHVHLNGVSRELPVRIKSLPNGVAALLATGTELGALPAWSKLSKL